MTYDKPSDKYIQFLSSVTQNEILWIIHLQDIE